MTIRRVHRNGKAYNVHDEPNTASWGYWHLFEDGTWEPEVLGLIEQMSPGDVLLDIGAWIGPMTLVAAMRGVRVIAIEPDPEAFRLLVANITLNNLHKQVTAIQAAVVPDDGVNSIDLYPVNEFGHSASSLVYQHGEPIKVDAISVRQLMQQCLRVNLVKMDIEGAETIVLPVLGPILRERRIPMVMATHIDRVTDEAFASMDDELSRWNTTKITGDQILCVPRVTE